MQLTNTMLKKYSLILLSATALGCSSMTPTTSLNSFGLLGKSDQVLSQWFYDSLPMCMIEGDQLESFVIPTPLDMWDRVRDGFQIPNELNKRVQQEINWYSKHPSYIARVSERASKYLFFIVEELDRRQMPLELALLPIVESAFDPFAYSHGRASGMWQVIPGTGEMLGLKQNWWYDGRRDVVDSTHAALDYLEQLHRQMDGDWLLALASYNSGAGNVNRAIRKNKKKGLPIDYWSLDLPKETEAYIPRLMAIKAMVERPAEFSVVLFDVPNQPYFEAVDIQSQIDLAQAAELAQMSMDDFYILNPAFNRWATDPDGPHRVLIPLDKAAQFKANLTQIPASERVTWHRYTIKSGDTLSDIADQFNTTIASLQSINDLQDNSIRAGKTLLVPQATAKASHYTYSLVERVKRKQSKGSGHKVHYVVRSGDSFWSIAKRYSVSSSKLAKWNAMAPTDPIHPGQKLVVWTKPSPDNNSQTVRKLAYKVRKGDSLAAIASRFNVRVGDILTWNQVNPKKYLQPGDRLTLFVDVTNIH